MILLNVDIQQAIDRTRFYLGTDSDQYNKLDGAITTSDTTLTFEFDLNGFGRGAKVEIRTSTDDEIVHVWSADTEAKTAVVERGWAGTSAITAADETLCAIRPAVSNAEIKEAVQEELRSLPGEGIHQESSASLTFDSEEDGYDLSGITDLISPFAVEIVYGNRTHWAYDFRRDDNLLRLLRDAPSLANGATLHYRAPLDTFAAKTDELTDLGVPASAVDIVPLGAAIRIMSSREPKRTKVQAQTHARTNEDVPPGANVRTLNQLERMRANRLRTERQRLRENWPMRRR